MKGNAAFRTLVLLAVIVILAGGAYFVIKQAQTSVSDLPVLGQLPDFEFTAQSGGMFGRREMRGKVNIVDFIFTRCKGPCPIMSGFMSELYQLYGGTDSVQFVSITVDPSYDSLKVLQAYAESHGVKDSRWVFLWAPIDSVVQLSEQGFMLAADDLPGSHTTKWVLVDKDANIRGYYSGTDEASIEVLKTHVARLVKEMK
ncbi:MAG: SCO family protein [Candidatus Zixiibacteriota bacterium]